MGRVSDVFEAPDRPHAPKQSRVAPEIVMRTLREVAAKERDARIRWMDTHHSLVRAIVDAGGPPREIETWWRSLAKPVRDELVHDAARLVGNLDGIPLAERIRANAVSVERFTAEDGPEGMFEPVKNERFIAFDPHLNMLASYNGPLDDETGNVPASVDNLAIYVPGTFAKMHMFRYEVMKTSWFMSHREKLAKQARAEGAPEPQSLATITWQVGFFPQMHWGPRGIDSLSNELGRRLGARLARLVESIHVADRTSIVPLGYSYGSITTAWAEVLGMRVNRSLTVAGPGLGPLGGRDGRVRVHPKTPRYSMLAPGDDVVGGGFQGVAVRARFGVLPSYSRDYIQIESGLIDDTDPSKGVVRGHADTIWVGRTAAMPNMLQVLIGGEVILESDTFESRRRRLALPGVLLALALRRQAAKDALLDSAYRPRLERVRGFADPALGPE